MTATVTERLPTRVVEGAPPRSRLRPDLVVAAGYLLLALWTCAGLLAAPYDRVSMHNPGDQVWFQWLFEHAAYSVRNLSNPLFSDRQNFPDGVNMMANTSILGISIPLVPVTMLFGGEISYLLLVIGGLAGTSYACYHVLSRHVVASRIGAAVAGGFIGFAPGVVHHASIGQPNFATHFLLPFIVLAAVRIGREGRVRRDGVTLGLLVTWQFFINQEMLLMTALVCAVLCVVRWRELWPARRRVFAVLGIAAGLAGVLLAYPMWFQFFGPQSYRGLPGTLHTLGEDFASYVNFAPESVYRFGRTHIDARDPEQNTWFGWPLALLAIAAAAFTWRRSVAARAATTVGLVFGVCAAGPKVTVAGEKPGIPGVWALATHFHVPVLDLVVPSRLALVVVAVVGVLIGVCWDHLAKVRRPRLAYAVVLLALVPAGPWVIPTQTAPGIPAFITDGHWRPYTAYGYTVLPSPVPNNADGYPSFRYSVRTKQEFVIPHGYFLGPGENGEGWFGPVSRKTQYWVNHVAKYGVIDGREDDLIAPTDEMKHTMREDLIYWKVGVVVVGPSKHSDELKRLWDQVLGPGVESHGAWIWDVRWLTTTGVR